MVETDNNPEWTTLTGRFLGTGFGALRNRGELLLVEWQEEKARLIELLILGIGVLFLAIMASLMLTGTIIFLFRQEHRVYAAAGFTVLYLGGAVWAVMTVKSLLKRQPFSETINQVKKDGECLESLK